MPFNYFDTNGFLAIGPTIPQWRQLADALWTGEQGRAFVQDGMTERPLALADEIRPQEHDEPVATLLQQLKDAAEKADEALFLNDGTAAAPEAE